MISKLRSTQSQLQKTELPYVYQTDLIDNFDFDELKVYVKTIKKEKKTFEKMIDKFDDLSSKEFFKYYKNFYSWDVDELKEKLIKNHLKDYEEMTIPTTDIFEEHTKMGYGSDAFWMSSYYYADYAVYAKKGAIEKGKIYTRKEVAELVNANKLLVKDIQCSSRFVPGNDKDIKNQMEAMKTIDINSKVDYLPCFYCDVRTLDDQAISKMYAANPKAFKLIKQEFSKERLESAYQTYSKQFDLAKDKCFKRAYKIIKSTKENIDGNEEKISQIKSFICNL